MLLNRLQYTGRWRIISPNGSRATAEKPWGKPTVEHPYEIVSSKKEGTADTHRSMNESYDVIPYKINTQKVHNPWFVQSSRKWKLVYTGKSRSVVAWDWRLWKEWIEKGHEEPVFLYLDFAGAFFRYIQLSKLIELHTFKKMLLIV